MSEAFTTLGCVMSESATSDSRIAAGVASPECPPISAPIPVGTIRTALKSDVDSWERRLNSNSGAIEYGISPLRTPTSHS